MAGGTGIPVSLTRQLGEALARVRRERNLTLVQLAQRSGVSKATLSAIEGAKRGDIGFGTLLRLQEALGLPSLELMLAGKTSTPSEEFAHQVGPGM
jgi:transcriptional regulator with XRE-family HTH domain